MHQEHYRTPFERENIIMTSLNTKLNIEQSDWKNKGNISLKEKGMKSSRYKKGGRNVKFTTHTKREYKQKSTTTNRNWPTKPTREEAKGFKKDLVLC